MLLTSIVVGTFGSGKTAHLLDLVCKAKCSAPDARILFVALSTAHITTARRRLDSSLARTIVWSTPAQLLAPDDRLVLPYDLVCVDDIDGPNMARLAQHICAMTATTSATKMVATARSHPAKFASVPCVAMLRTSHRTANMTWFLQRLFTPQQPQQTTGQDNTVRLITYTNKADIATSVWSALASATVPAAVLCNSEAVLMAVTALAPSMNRVRRAQSLCALDIGDTLHLSSTSRFYGRECASTILVMSDGDTRADLVEGVTRHTHTLALVFDAGAPPQCLCDAALADLVPTYVNWAPRKPHMTVRGLAARVSPSAISANASISDACDAVCTALQKQISGFGNAKAVYVTNTFSSLVPHDDDDALLCALGTAVEALFALCLPVTVDTQIDFFPTVDARTRIAEAVARGGWWPDDVEELMWSLVKRIMCKVWQQCRQKKRFFHYVVHRIRYMLRACSMSHVTAQSQVPLSMNLTDGTRVSGVADFLVSRQPDDSQAVIEPEQAVIEVKYVQTLTPATYAQTLLYMHALGVRDGYLCNVRNGEVVHLAFTKS